jgi:hypothetical protein
MLGPYHRTTQLTPDKSDYPTSAGVDSTCPATAANEANVRVLGSGTAFAHESKGRVEVGHGSQNQGGGAGKDAGATKNEGAEKQQETAGPSSLRSVGMTGVRARGERERRRD